MSTQSNQFLSIRRFGVRYLRLPEGRTRFDYVVPFNSDTGHTARDPLSALHEFHKFMQRSKGLSPDDYKVLEIFSIHQDAQRQEVRMTYDTPGGGNPDVRGRKTKPAPTPCSMFDDEVIKEESKRALAAR